LLLCISTVRVALAVLKFKTSPKKDAERRDKVSTRAGKETEPMAWVVKPSKRQAMLKTAPPDCDEKQPES